MNDALQSYYVARSISSNIQRSLLTSGCVSVMVCVYMSPCVREIMRVWCVPVYGCACECACERVRERACVLSVC
jgi:hypothetical protein